MNYCLLDKQHIDAIHKIENSVFSDGYSQNTLNGIAENGLYRFSVVVMEGQILAGYIIAAWVAGEAEILRIAVDKSMHGRGYGKALLEHFISSTPADTIFLEVRKSNTAAISLYQKAGFQKVGERKGYYDNGEDALLYTYYR